MPTLHLSGLASPRRSVTARVTRAARAHTLALASRIAAAFAMILALIAGTPAANAAGAPAPAAATAPAASAPLAMTATGLVRMPDGRLLAPEFARIVTRGELVVAMLGVDQPPFFETRNGRLQGIDVDIADELAAKLGVKVRFNRDAKTYDGVVAQLANGDADLAVSKLSRTLARAELISFSTPYVRLHRALLLNRLNFAQVAHGRPAPEVIRSYDSTIGVVMNSSYSQYVQTNFPNAKVRAYPSWDALLGGLDKGEVTAAYRDEFEVKHVLKSDPTASLKLRVVTLDDLEDPIAIGVNVSTPALLAFVNQFLAERSKKLDVQTLLQATDN
jgi:ABC-type amino acid transport substrate-binding protein